MTWRLQPWRGEARFRRGCGCTSWVYVVVFWSTNGFYSAPGETSSRLQVMLASKLW